MQHWYACQVEVAPRGVPMTGHIVFSLLIGAMHLQILQLPHAHHVIFFLEVAGTTSLIYIYAGTVSYLESFVNLFYYNDLNFMVSRK